MDKERLKKLVQNPGLISGIYNYCARWCEMLDPDVVIRITNDYRAAKGLSSLKTNPQLSRAAKAGPGQTV